jgi:hypothetical protein
MAVPRAGRENFRGRPGKIAFTSFAKLFIALSCVQQAPQFQPKPRPVTAMAMDPANQYGMRLADDDRRPGQDFRKDGKLIIISLRSGRLANRLTLFAHFIALAEEQGHRIVNFAFHSYAHLFETTRRDIYCRYPAAERRSWLDVVPGVAAAIRKTRICYQIVCYASIWNESFPVFGKKVVTLREKPWSNVIPLDGPEVQAQIRDARIVFAHGWPFRVPTSWLQRHAEKIRAYFRPIEEHDRASREAVDRLRRDADLVVGVHVRHGDYGTWRWGRYFFPASRYAGWMREMAAQFPGRKVAFFVCSDSPRTADEFPGLSVGLGAGSPVGDLYALARCDYIFGPLSTFSQWASFYGKKPLFLLNDASDRLERAKFRVSCLDVI